MNDPSPPIDPFTLTDLFLQRHTRTAHEPLYPSPHKLIEAFLFISVAQLS